MSSSDERSSLDRVIEANATTRLAEHLADDHPWLSGKRSRALAEGLREHPAAVLAVLGLDTDAALHDLLRLRAERRAFSRGFEAGVDAADDEESTLDWETAWDDEGPCAHQAQSLVVCPDGYWWFCGQCLIRVRRAKLSELPGDGKAVAS